MHEGVLALVDRPYLDDTGPVVRLMVEKQEVRRKCQSKLSLW